MPNRLNILFLTQVLPYPLVGGAKIRAYYVLRSLVKNHRVTLVSFVREDDDDSALNHLGRLCDSVYTVEMTRSPLRDVVALGESIVRNQPTVIIRDRQLKMRRLLQKLISNNSYDLIHADQTAMAQYAIFTREFCALDKPAIVLDQHNALYLVVRRQAEYETGLRRLIWRREAGLLSKYEKEMCLHFDQIFTVSEEDKIALLNLYGIQEKGLIESRFTTVPICHDPSLKPLPEMLSKSHNIIHLGTMFWPPNIEGVLWFAQQVMPLIVNEVSDAKFIIAGKAPPNNIRALADQGSPLGAHFEVSGFVLDSTAIYERSRVFVVPVRAGGGMRVKILDAWLHGIPVVSTTIGAEGIAAEHNKSLLLADDPESFAEAVVSVMNDDNIAESLRRSARNQLENEYDWRIRYRVIDDVYQKAVERSS